MNLSIAQVSDGSNPDEAGGWPQLEPGTPLDWNEHDVPRAFAEMYPEASLADFLWR